MTDKKSLPSSSEKISTNADRIGDVDREPLQGMVTTPFEASSVTGSDSRTSTVDAFEPTEDTPAADHDTPKVPTLGKVETDAGTQAWSRATSLAAAHFNSLQARSRDALRRALAMIYLAVLVVPKEVFKEMLRDAAMEPPKSNGSFAVAVAAYFGFDIMHSDKTLRKRNSNKVNEYSSALGRLDEIITAEWSAADLTYDEAGVHKIAELIKNRGGVSVLAREFMSGNSADKNPDLIELDLQRVQEITFERGKERLRNAAPEGASLLGISAAYRQGKTTVAGPLFEDLPDDIIAQIYRSVGAVDERVGLYAEMFQVANAIEEPLTDILVENEADPADPHAARRVATRQIIFNPDGSVSASSILTDTSVVVVTGPARFLEFDVQGHLQLETKGRRKLGRNLANVSALPALEIDFEGPGETQGITRLILSSPAVKDKATCKQIDVLVQYSRSKAGNFPLIVDDATFDPEFTAEISTVAWSGWLHEFPDALKTIPNKDSARLEVQLRSKQARFVSGTRKYEVDLNGGSGDLNLDIAVSDYLRIAGALGQIKIQGPVKLRADADMLAFRFETMRNTYSLYVPALMLKGGRSRRHLKRLKPQPWPTSRP